MGVYLWQEYSWTPWADTLVYYKFATDLNDYSWNNLNLSSSSVTFSNNKMTNTSNVNWTPILNWHQWAFTVSCWTTWTWTNIGDRDSWGFQWFIRATWWSSDWWGNAIIANSWRRAWNQTAAWSSSDFVHLVMVYNGSLLVCYLNGVKTGTTTSVSWNIKGTASQFQIATGTWGEFIIEWKAWTAQEISDHYNWTKSNYGL